MGNPGPLTPTPAISSLASAYVVSSLALPVVCSSLVPALCPQPKPPPAVLGWTLCIFEFVINKAQCLLDGLGVCDALKKSY